MKLLILPLLLVLTACSGSGGADKPKAHTFSDQGPLVKAVSPDGSCTAEVLQDAREVAKASDDAELDLAEIERTKENRSAVLQSVRLNAMSMSVVFRSFVMKYGDFQCTYKEDQTGKIQTLNSGTFKGAADRIDKAVGKI